jgi:hypothetical protein
MLPTSGTYNFQSIQVEILIREAFERIGLSGEFIDTLKLESAKRSINLLLLEWMEKTVNLWTLQEAYLALVPGQRQYILPTNHLNIIQVNLRTSARQLNGNAQTNTGNTYDGQGGGNANNAFDGINSTACTQTVPDGNISYDYGANNTETITFIGIQSNSTTLYTLVVESCPADPTVLNSWTTLLTIPAQVFTAGVNTWFDIPTPVAGRAYRIREIGGATLDIQEIFFNNNTYDYTISNVSRYEYNTYPNKYLQSRPTVYYLDRKITPILNIWPTAAPQYNCIFYSYKKMMQDVGLYSDTIEIPAKFYPALIWGLSWSLAVKFNPQLADMFENKYQQAFIIATTEDSESTSITVLGDIS